MIHNVRVYTSRELAAEEIDELIDAVDYVVDVVPRDFYDNEHNMQVSYLNVYDQEEGDWVYEMSVARMLQDTDAQEIIEILSEFLDVDFDLDASFEEDECEACNAN
ncbi:MAG: hypothetical protein CMN60_21370 [Sphingobium sp.]|nr:hypothetical protein [Sphingobium sp.]MBS50183.1 hypothetical protein [Sphingobium sp.]|tara:strand:+ start:24898 stop:25215 length:318 start_codon:yes stop_codon:yes gene_type:complete